MSRLGQKRRVDPDRRTGTSFILDELSSLGYVGKWSTVNPHGFFLPQSRKRVYGMFLKIACLMEQGRSLRATQLEKAADLINKLQLRSAEPISAVLERLPAVSQSPPVASHPAKSKPQRAAKGEPPKWHKEHDNFMKLKALRPQMLDTEDARSFKSAGQGVLGERGLQAMLLRVLVDQFRKGASWKKGIWIANTGASVRFISLRRDCDAVHDCAGRGFPPSRWHHHSGYAGHPAQGG